MKKTSTLVSIGELSKKTGVAVRTIRYYSNEALLPPSSLSPAGYRLYSDQDQARLETIKALRAFDFDLGQIRALLEGEQSPKAAFLLRAEAIELQLKQLQRARSVLRQLADQSEEQCLVQLTRLQTLSQLEALERKVFLSRKLRQALQEIPIDKNWLESILEAAFGNFPEEMSTEQWQALTELVTMVDSEDFAQAMAQQAKPFWQKASHFEPQSWQEAIQGLLNQGLPVVEAKLPPNSMPAQALVDSFCELWAAAMNREVDQDLKRELLAQQQAQDPRGQRLWQLVAIIRSQPESPHQRVFDYIYRCLEDQLGKA